eukprot:3188480-Prymnesium_polylepis.1
MPPERQNAKTKTSAAKHTRERRRGGSATAHGRRLSAACSRERGERSREAVVEILVVGEISVVVVVARVARSVELVKLLA